MSLSAVTLGDVEVAAVFLAGMFAACFLILLVCAAFARGGSR